MSNEWVMVPRDPTEAMFSASSFQEWDTFEQEWRAMLYAAPAAPQQAEPVAWPAGHRWARNMAALESQSESDPTAPIIAPQRAELVVARKWLRLTPEELVVIWQNNDWQNHSDANLSDLIQDALIHKNEGSGGASAELANLRAEVESLRHTKEAFDEWLAKTDWVQKSAAVNELGKHRADVLRDRIEALRAALKPFAAIDLTTNQAVDAMDVLRARRALEGQ